MSDTVAPVIGYGASLSYNGTNLATVLDIKLPETEVAKVKTTSLNSTPAYHETWMPGLVDDSTCDVIFQYNEIDFAALLGFASSRTVVSWVITAHASLETWSFSGFINKGPSADFKPGDLVESKFSIQCTSGFEYNPVGSGSVLGMADGVLNMGYVHDGGGWTK